MENEEILDSKTMDKVEDDKRDQEEKSPYLNKKIIEDYCINGG